MSSWLIKTSHPPHSPASPVVWTTWPFFSCGIFEELNNLVLQSSNVHSQSKWVHSFRFPMNPYCLDSIMNSTAEERYLWQGPLRLWKQAENLVLESERTKTSIICCFCWIFAVSEIFELLWVVPACLQNWREPNLSVHSCSSLRAKSPCWHVSTTLQCVVEYRWQTMGIVGCLCTLERPQENQGRAAHPPCSNANKKTVQMTYANRWKTFVFFL